MSVAQNCETCRFWLESKRSPYGQCWRYPPQVIKINSQATTVSPETHKQSLCGEYKKVSNDPA
jgi:hypothetical protein